MLEEICTGWGRVGGCEWLILKVSLYIEDDNRKVKKEEKESAPQRKSWLRPC